jgi:heptosyltransferase-2
MTPVMKILTISLAGIGDTLCATPMIGEIRKNFPKARIDVFVMWKGAREVLENNPDIDNLYQFNMIKHGFVKSLNFLLKLRRNSYDISINSYPQSKMQYRIVSAVIGAKKRISHRYDNSNFLDRFLINKSIEQDYSIHFIENNLNLLKALEIKPKLKKHLYKVFLSDTNLKNSESFIIKNKLRGKTLFGLHAGCGSTKNLALRRWPLENFESLIRMVLEKNEKVCFLLFGGGEEIQDNLELARRIKSKRVLIIEKDNILDSAAILKKCKIFLSVDTVLMHLATAVNVKIQVVIKTPTYNKTVEPYRKKFILIGNRVPSNLYYLYDGKGIRGKKEEIIKYMKSITPKQVYDRVRRYI